MPYTASLHNKVLETADKMWGNSIQQKDYIAAADVLNVVRNNQTAQFAPLLDPHKDNTVKITWFNPDGVAAVDYAADCAFDGEELITASKEYEMEPGYQKTYRIKEREFRTNQYSYEEAYAKVLLLADKYLSERLAASLTARIESWAAQSSNPYNADGTWTVPAIGITNIPNNQWNSSIMGRFVLAAQLSRFSNAYLISGQNLAYQNWEAMTNITQSGNQGDMTRFKALPINFDLWNIDSTASANRTYMLDRNAVAVVTKNRFDAMPYEYGNGANITHFSVASYNMPGVRIDVYYRTECQADEIEHVFKFVIRPGIFLNPTGINATRTGLIGFHKQKRCFFSWDYNFFRISINPYSRVYLFFTQLNVPF